jgi:hypothetical protein
MCRRRGNDALHQVGGVSFVKGGVQPPRFFRTKISNELLAEWLPKNNQISQVELFAAVLAASRPPENTMRRRKRRRRSTRRILLLALIQLIRALDREQT